MSWKAPAATIQLLGCDSNKETYKPHGPGAHALQHPGLYQCRGSFEWETGVDAFTDLYENWQCIVQHSIK